jgi:plastocyanin
VTRQSHLLILIVACLLSPVASAATVRALVTDHKGEPLEHAVITVRTEGSSAVKASPAKRTVDQVDKEFVPHVLVVEQGSPVYFPNRDDIRHHVYSFSKPKKFELPLYKGTPAEPIVFDKPGVVKLGCNIHDWMLGYIYIVDTPFYVITGKSGVATLKNLPSGKATVTVWHPRQKGKPEKTAKQVALSASGETRVDFNLKVRKEFRMRRAPRAGGKKY